jgi:hypothetical protein
MHIITRKALVEFWTRHPDSREALARWHKIVEKSSYQSFAELRLTFPSADIVGQLHGVQYRRQQGQIDCVNPLRPWQSLCPACVDARGIQPGLWKR